MELSLQDFWTCVQYCHWFYIYSNKCNILDLMFVRWSMVYFIWICKQSKLSTLGCCKACTSTDLSLHADKVGVWVAMSMARIYELVLFKDIFNGEYYCNNILKSFIEQLLDHVLQIGYFQQDNVAAYCISNNCTALTDFRIWLSKSSDLTRPTSFCVQLIHYNFFHIILINRNSRHQK